MQIGNATYEIELFVPLLSSNLFVFASLLFPIFLVNDLNSFCRYRLFFLLFPENIDTVMYNRNRRVFWKKEDIRHDLLVYAFKMWD